MKRAHTNICMAPPRWAHDTRMFAAQLHLRVARRRPMQWFIPLEHHLVLNVASHCRSHHAEQFIDMYFPRLNLSLQACLSSAADAHLASIGHWNAINGHIPSAADMSSGQSGRKPADWFCSNSFEFQSKLEPNRIPNFIGVDPGCATTAQIWSSPTLPHAPPEDNGGRKRGGGASEQGAPETETKETHRCRHHEGIGDGGGGEGGGKNGIEAMGRTNKGERKSEGPDKRRCRPPARTRAPPPHTHTLLK